MDYVNGGGLHHIRGLSGGKEVGSFHLYLPGNLEQILILCTWHASLLDPASYPSPETSCTTFIVYALAYGINEGLLDKDTFLPILVKGWNAQVSAVDADGKLGYVQPIGADPKKVTRNMTEVYGVGAFLMGGCEIYKMAR